MILVPLSIFLSVSSPGVPLEKVSIAPGRIAKKEDAVKVFVTPDDKGSITVQSLNQNELSFYLFDVEGNLVYQSTIKKGEKQFVQGLTKGTYLYNAFKNDENIKGGKIILK